MVRVARNYFFFFPIECNLGESDRVAGERIDGQSFNVSGGHIRKLAPFLDDIDCLNANMKFTDSASKLEHVLNQHLPSLQALRIQIILGCRDEFGRVYDPPSYTLSGANLPELCTLMAIDTLVHFDYPLCRNLRFLHLEYTEGDEPHVSLPNFLEILRNCTVLEALWEDRYITFSYPGDTVAPPVLSLMDRPQLTHLRFGEKPSSVKKILSSLIIPAHVVVVAAGHVRDNPAAVFSTMLPDDRTKLPILRRSTMLIVTHCQKDNCGIYGGMLHASAPAGDLGLEVRPTHEDTLGEISHPEYWKVKPDGTLLHSMVQMAHIFRDCPVKHFAVRGNLGMVSASSWISAFSLFPDADVLDLEDIRDRPEDRFAQLCIALTSTMTGSREGLVYPQLRHFRLQAADLYDPQMLDLLIDCLGQRAQRYGAQPLREIRFTLTSERSWGETAMRYVRRKFAPYATAVDLAHIPASAMNRIVREH